MCEGRGAVYVRPFASWADHCHHPTPLNTPGASATHKEASEEARAHQRPLLPLAASRSRTVKAQLACHPQPRPARLLASHHKLSISATYRERRLGAAILVRRQRAPRLGTCSVLRRSQDVVDEQDGAYDNPLLVHLGLPRGAA